MGLRGAWAAVDIWGPGAASLSFLELRLSVAPPRSASHRSTSSRLSRPLCALDTDLRLDQLADVARLESHRKELHRPLYHVHKWWANRLGSVFRAILLAGNSPPETDLLAEFYQPQAFPGRIVLDPFMGSGTTIGEALKLGCQAIGADINPIATFQVEQALRDQDEARLRSALEHLDAIAQREILPLYQSSYDGSPAQVQYAFWVEVLPCPECGAKSRLFDRWIFAADAYPRRRPRAQALCPACSELVTVDQRESTATCRTCRHRFAPNSGPATRQSFVCESCGQSARILDVLSTLAGPPEHQMYALMLRLPDGRRVYKLPDDADLARYARARQSLARSRLPLPTARIPRGHNTDQARRHNYTHWHQLFNHRQLLALGRLLRGILTEPDPTLREALLVLFSGALEFNNMFCSFKGEGTGAVRHLFAHHILRPPRTPLEANPWGARGSSGSFLTLFDRRLIAARRYREAPFELRPRRRPGGGVSTEKVFGLSPPLRPKLASSFDDIAARRADVWLLTGDSSRLPLPNRSVDLVVTDPPYFDNVHYSELADFFYSWLRGPLGRARAPFRRQSTRSPREVQGVTAAEFGTRLRDVLGECARVMKNDAALALTFHHSRLESWTQLANAIRGAGLRVVATHPVLAEMTAASPKRRSKDPIQLDLVVVCRQAPACPVMSRHRVSLGEVRQRAVRKIRRQSRAGLRLSRGDLRVVLMGEILVAFADSDWPGRYRGRSFEAVLESAVEDLVSHASAADSRLSPRRARRPTEGSR